MKTITKNKVEITVKDGTVITKHTKTDIPTIRKTYALGRRINYAGKTGSVKNGEIESTTITSITNYKTEENA